VILHTTAGSIETCIEQGGLGVKPLIRGGGHNIFVIKHVNEKLLLNNSPSTVSAVKALFAQLNNYVVCEYVHQHSYASDIFPHSINTIRLLTMWRDDVKFPFVTIAVHRFGTNATIPVDNWSRGGLSSLIDLKTGTLGMGVSYPRNSRLTWCRNHPDTNAKIEGVQIPSWRKAKSKILKIAKEVPFIPYIGWDIVVTNDDIQIIEGNNYPDVNLLQVHRPLLTIPHVKEFYQKCGVI